MNLFEIDCIDTITYNEELIKIVWTCPYMIGRYLHKMVEALQLDDHRKERSRPNS